MKSRVNIPWYRYMFCWLGFCYTTRFYNEHGLLHTKYVKCVCCGCNKKAN